MAIERGTMDHNDTGEGSGGGVAQWVVNHTWQWETYRNTNFQARWKEYFRMWNTIWAKDDQERQSERSRAIMPTVSQAVDSAVAEQETALFDRQRWFDVADDVLDQRRGDIEQMATLLLEDLDRTSAKQAITETMLNGGIFGTGISKLVPVRDQNGALMIRVVPVEPGQFVIDPSARHIDDGMGCAHITVIPKALVQRRQKEGIYDPKVDPGTFQRNLNDGTSGGSSITEQMHVADGQSWLHAQMVKITEYHGLVPRKMLPRGNQFTEPAKLPYEQEELVEAIVTVANNQVVLKATENPFGNRGFVAYPHDKVPNRFWGRGIPEKVYWAQKVLDSEIRARNDALALSTHGMMAVNTSMVPRGETFRVRPGRNIFVSGDPKQALTPINFNPPDPQTYEQARSMQAMIELGSGSIQAVAATEHAQRAAVGGLSILMGTSIKRTKRVMNNMEEYYIKPMIQKLIQRYQFLRPDRYTGGDFKFQVKGSLGIMAREMEQQNLAQLLQVLPPDSPMQLLVSRAIIANSSLMDRDLLLTVTDQFIAQAMNPQPPQPSFLEQAALQDSDTKRMQVEAERANNEAERQLEAGRLQVDTRRLDNQHREAIGNLTLDAKRIEADADKKATESVLNIAKAMSEDTKSSIEALAAKVEEAKEVQAELPTVEAQDNEAIDALIARIEALENTPAPELEELELEVERDANNLVRSINGQPVRRNSAGVIEGFE